MAETSVITKRRRILLCQITSGAITTLPNITHIALGTGGVDENGEPFIPSDLQTALNHPIGQYEIDPVTYPEETTARYTITVPEHELVGEKISEAGLIDADGNLCAVKNMYVKQKDNGVSFTFTFDDQF